MATAVESPRPDDQRQSSSPTEEMLEEQRRRKEEEFENLAKEIGSKDLKTRLEWAEKTWSDPLDTDIEWLHRKVYYCN